MKTLSFGNTMLYQGIINGPSGNELMSRLVVSVGQVLLIALTLLLFYPALSWMFDAFTSQEHRFQLIGIMMLSTFLVYKQFDHHTRLNWQFSLQLRQYPILLFLSCTTGFVLNEYFIDIHIISATLCILAFYALFGFFCSKRLWQRGLTPTLLLIILLPFGDYLNVYLGFPLRLFSAYAAADTLTAFGYPSMSSETIIVLENQYSNVDLSCSGIKGIWSGLAFFVLLSWVENKSIGAAWLWRLAVFVLALISANILRIIILVLLGSHFSYFEFADLIHEMLGIIGFTLACLVGWGLLLTQKENPLSTRSQKQPSKKIKENETIKKPHLSWILLISTIMVLNIIYTPMPKANTHTVNTNLNLPDHWSPKLVDLTIEENEFFNRNQTQANKFSLLLENNVNASLIAVHSTYWKGQHDPKNCLMSQGYRITNDTTLRLSTTQSVRYLQLARQNTKYIAIYWFQNSKHITDDYSKRIFTSIFDRNTPWVLSSLLIEKPEHSNLNIREIINPIHATIHKKLQQATLHEPKN